MRGEERVGEVLKGAREEGGEMAGGWFPARDECHREGWHCRSGSSVTPGSKEEGKAEEERAVEVLEKVRRRGERRLEGGSPPATNVTGRPAVKPRVRREGGESAEGKKRELSKSPVPVGPLRSMSEGGKEGRVLRERERVEQQ